MKAKCISNRGRNLPHLYRDPSAGYGADADFPLTLEKEYVVYALTVRRGALWYYVFDDNGVWYPVWYPAALFAITDSRVSRYWVVGLYREGLGDGSAIVAVAPWAKDPYVFYDRLTDGDPEVRNTFSTYRALMDHEFDLAEQQAVADDVGNGWLACSICRWVWRQAVRGSLIRCPECGNSLRMSSLLNA